VSLSQPIRPFVGKPAERDAVLLLGDEFRAQRIFQRFHERNSRSAENRNQCQSGAAGRQRNMHTHMVADIR
jgi:hypothetical protein